MVYVETSYLLALARDKRVLDGDWVVSDVVVAEVHNLDEPERSWAASYLAQYQPLCLRLEVEDVKVAMRYVYNGVLSQQEFPLGLHYVVAASRGVGKLFTCVSELASRKARMDDLKDYLGMEVCEVELFEGKYPDTLLKVRDMMGRLCFSQGDVRFTAAVKESVEFLFREKGFRLRRVNRVHG